jgi:membrane-associated protein
MFSIETLLLYVGSLSYVGVVVALIIGGYILPIPEEAILILLGYFVRAEVFHPTPLFIAALMGVMVHDHALYILARRGSRYTTWVIATFEESPFLRRHMLDDLKLWKVLTMFRFVPYLRLAGPILAGSTKMPWKKFFLINTPVLVVYVSFTLGVGFIFHRALETILTKVSEAEHITIVVLLGITAFMLGWYLKHVFGFVKKE